MLAGHRHPDSCFISSYIIVPPETFKPLVISPLPLSVIPLAPVLPTSAALAQKVRDYSTCLKCVAPRRVFVFLLTQRKYILQMLFHCYNEGPRTHQPAGRHCFISENGSY